MEKYEKILKKLAYKAYKKNEVPVAALIVKNNKIISKAYNKKNSSNNPMLHAEIIAINKACKKLKNWRLNNCKMYVTLNPCEMCKQIINESRIKEVIYVLERNNQNKIVTKFTKSSINNEIFNKLLTEFFRNKR